jgi:hypothetical protein
MSLVSPLKKNKEPVLSSAELAESEHGSAFNNSSEFTNNSLLVPLNIYIILEEWRVRWARRLGGVALSWIRWFAKVVVACG